ncbi:MAG: VOC family protein [Verrucomicrobiales bacterium]
MANLLVWIDIPVRDLERAVQFYSGVLDRKVRCEEFPGMAIGVFEHGGDEVAGCLFISEKNDPAPSTDGVLAYFNCTGRLDAAVARVAELGGEVLQPTHPIGQHGFRAVVKDSEGNRIALHSP